MTFASSGSPDVIDLRHRDNRLPLHRRLPDCKNAYFPVNISPVSMTPREAASTSNEYILQICRMYSLQICTFSVDMYIVHSPLNAWSVKRVGVAVRFEVLIIASGLIELLDRDRFTSYTNLSPATVSHHCTHSRTHTTCMLYTYLRSCYWHTKCLMVCWRHA